MQAPEHATSGSIVDAGLRRCLSPAALPARPSMRSNREVVERQGSQAPCPVGEAEQGARRRARGGILGRRFALDAGRAREAVWSPRARGARFRSDRGDARSA